jgi:outer membrane protein insertion porin family
MMQFRFIQSLFITLTKKKSYSFFIAITLAIITTSCSVKQLIVPDQFYLNKIDVKINDNFKESKSLIADLRTIIIQKSSIEKENRNRIQRLFTKTKRTIYSKTDTEKSVQKMQSYLRNKGYFDVSVNSEENIIGIKEIEVIYKVNLARKYVVKNLSYLSDNKDILNILNSNINYSLLKKDVPIELSYCDQERLRITDLLNNNGYAQFTPNYVDIVEIDTLNQSFSSDNIAKVNCSIQILNQINNKNHLKYTVGKITIDPNYNPTINYTIRRDTLIDGFHYELHSVSGDSSMIVDPKTINSKIRIFQDSIYNKQNLNQTKKDLSKLEIYSFINVKNEIIEDSTGNFINYHISLSPQKSKSINGGLTSNYSSIGPTGNQINVFGISGNIGFVNRNALKGAEQLSLNINAGIDFRYSSNIGLNMILSYPKYVDTKVNVMRLYNKVGLLSNRFYQNLQKNGTTQISGNLNYFNLKDYYNYISLDLNYSYRVNIRNDQYRINRTGLSIFFPNILPRFDTVLKNNDFLKKSYQPQLSTGFLMREVIFSTINYLDLKQSSNSFKINVEQSGAELYALNQLFDAKNTFKLGNLNYAQYAKLEMEFRKAHYFSNKHGLVGRLGLGIASAYGNSTTVPFNEQLFLGGPNSLRAWRIRGVGPGGFKDATSNSSEIQSQTGDFKLEASIEYRYPIIKLFKTIQVEGALFLDAGNIWTVNDDPNSPNQWFNKNFTKQIAIGSGTGIRVDVNYFLFRLDVGLRMRNPYPEEDTNAKNFDLYRTFSKLSELNSELLNWNIALDYPF